MTVPHGFWRIGLTMMVFALAAAVNTGSVALLTRHFGRRGWSIHLVLVLPLWGVFLSLLPGLGQHVRWPLPRGPRLLGLLILGGAAALWVLAYRQLGGAHTANGNLFGHGEQARVTGSVFRFVENPVYLSYLLAFIGLALRRGNTVDLLLAGESYVLLNQVEAKAENWLLPERRVPVVTH